MESLIRVKTNRKEIRNKEEKNTEKFKITTERVVDTIIFDN